VFAGIYPDDPDDYEDLEKSLTKLCLTDGSVVMNYESSAALGSGFRCGFLGMLHMDVFRQRLKDEHDISAIMTQPSVSYLVMTINAKADKREKPKEVMELLANVDPDSEDALLMRVNNPTEAPRTELIKYWKEALVLATIITPVDYAKEVKKLCDTRRGVAKSEEFMSGGKVINLRYLIPLSELISDFFDTLKSIS
jgi:translation elongation factor EF-4